MSSWKAGLCDCTKALPVCCISCIATSAITQGLTANKMYDECGGWFFCIACILGPIGCAMNRREFRNEYNIEGSFANDCLMYCCCMGVCLSTQEFREVHFRTLSKHKQTEKPEEKEI
ncbi:unnamed protein product [Blepharisma stoltei]|uniref:Uncharacterized protein n=1 Tax=Blepharisma stoltei TaxID=1481888 RepID=A0AAU9JSX8_9CILI|nr:unnamed protein product [Blepharisma stoltei]